MKKLSILGLGTLAIMCACNSKPSTEYTINGTTDLADGEMVRMMYNVSADSTVKDSCVVANGAFTFTGSIEQPKQGYIYAGEMTYGNNKMRQLMVEPGTITVALNGDDYKAAEITGSPLTAQMDSLNTIVNGVYEQMMPLREQFMAAQGDSVATAELEKKYDALIDQMKTAQKDFVKNHPGSYYTPIVFSQLMSDMNLDELKEAYNAWTPEVQAAAPQVAKYITALENIQPGSKAPEIIGMDQDGNQIMLADYKGHVVLLDFWATWCGPCRASLPHVKEIYEKYADKGLVVMAVSLDHSEEPWKDYIANSGMGMEKYANIYDKPVGNADNYAIQYIPSKFIIDAEGNMVGRFDDGNALEAKLEEMLGK